MNALAWRGAALVMAVCVAMTAGCVDSGDSDTMVQSAACEYVEAVLTGDQSQVDALAGRTVDLKDETDALGGWIGIDRTSVSGSAADDVFASASGEVLWTGSGDEAPREWAVDVMVKVGGLSAPNTVRVFGQLTPESKVVVERFGQAP